MLKIVEATPEEKGRAPRTLTITVEGDSLDEINSYAAKKLAYDERVKHGFSEAGIEYLGGPYPIVKPVMDTPEGAEVTLGSYRRAFQLTQAV
jgi:hypothetical protein